MWRVWARRLLLQSSDEPTCCTSTITYGDQPGHFRKVLRVWQETVTSTDCHGRIPPTVGISRQSNGTLAISWVGFVGASVPAMMVVPTLQYC